jgi:signal transduction histidine kinase
MPDKFRSLVDAGIALSSELSLDELLQKVVETAAEITGARYAALGVIDPSGTGLERFVYTGIDDEMAARIGDLPRGRGILGALIHDARALRLKDLSADPRSVGFPEHHPPMRTFLGVPVLLRGVAYGNLYLTEKEGGAEFTTEDEEVVILLATQAAVAVENARLYEATKRWSRQLESLNEVANALASELELSRLLDLIARRLRELLDARVVGIALPAGEHELRFLAADGEGADELRGSAVAHSRSKSGRILERARGERVDSLLDDPEADQDVARRLGARAGLWVPLLVRGQAIGVVNVFDKLAPDPRFTGDDVRLAEAFAARAAVAVDLSRRVARDVLERVVDAQELERQRLARELHDETGQALTSALLGLKAVEDAKSEDELRGRIAELRESLVTTLQDVRRLAVELRPSALDDFGLVPALERLADTYREQTGLAIDFQARLDTERLPSDVETALYRIVQEALTNVVKHARATSISILVTRKDGSVAAVIEDDGAGFEPGQASSGGFGLVGMRERLALLDGRLEVESSTGSGTTVVAEVPLR